MLSRLSGDSGTVEFDAVTSESVEMSNRITYFAVEDGQDVADHISLEPETLPISGVIAGEDAFQRLTILRNFRNNKEILTFVGRNVFANVVIETLTTRHNARTRDGFEFDMTLRRVRLSRVREVQITPVMRTQVRPVQNQGIQQPKPVEPKEPFFVFRPRGST